VGIIQVMENSTPDAISGTRQALQMEMTDQCSISASRSSSAGLGKSRSF
jgi:hypothetical protein